MTMLRKQNKRQRAEPKRQQPRQYRPKRSFLNEGVLETRGNPRVERKQRRGAV
jgi:hypothetical protein